MRKTWWLSLALAGCIDFEAAVKDCVAAGLCTDGGSAGGSGTAGGGMGGAGGTAGSGGGGGGAAGGATSGAFTVTPGSLTFPARELDAGPDSRALNLTNTSALSLLGLTYRLMPAE